MGGAPGFGLSFGAKRSSVSNFPCCVGVVWYVRWPRKLAQAKRCRIFRLGSLPPVCDASDLGQRGLQHLQRGFSMWTPHHPLHRLVQPECELHAEKDPVHSGIRGRILFASPLCCVVPDLLGGRASERGSRRRSRSAKPKRSACFIQCKRNKW